MNDLLYADVILPLYLQKEYTYVVPVDMHEHIQIGQRVIVQFGKRRLYTAIVYRLYNQAHLAYHPKRIESIVDENPIVSKKQIQLWEWISTYYMCTLGEVMTAALPSALKLSSETILVYVFSGSIHDVPFNNDDEYILAQALEANQEIKLDDIPQILSKKTVYPVVESLMKQRICATKEEVKQKYKPKEVAFLYLNERYKKEDALLVLFDQLERKPKQLNVLMNFLHLSPNRLPIPKNKLSSLQQVSNSSIQTLIKHGVLEESKKSVSRLLHERIQINVSEPLNNDQEKAYKAIQSHFQKQSIVVLEGVTGSGKTHVYVECILQAIQEKKQVLYLLPEIALTAQIVKRLQAYFGNKVGVYHSRFNEQERVEIYQKVQKGEYDVILSARSGIFLPFQQLGLIVVDEEHDFSYKQTDPAPRYHARDVAIILSGMYQANVLLGSATLSLETKRNVEIGKYAHVLLQKRHADVALPEITLLNTAELARKKKMEGVLSQPLKEAIETALHQKEQIILFQNRRGYAHYLNCQICHWIPQCPNCDVSLTYHKYIKSLVCHYCGHKDHVHTSCLACGSSDMQIFGMGTEQIEHELALMFPNASIARMDLDTTRRKQAHEELIFSFQNREIDILVGTQMVAKGLDFDNVSIVGVLDADRIIHFPDFRSIERAFQLFIQVSGRAGRQKKGNVYIQTKKPEQEVLQWTQNHHSNAFYLYELQSRQQLHYPPFVNLIQIEVKGKQIQAVEEASRKLAVDLRNQLQTRVLGPTVPIVSKIRNYYLRHILIKLEKDQTFIRSVKDIIHQQLVQLQQNYRQIKFLINVDP